jgi:hypothetical protein
MKVFLIFWPWGYLMEVSLIFWLWRYLMEVIQIFWLWGYPMEVFLIFWLWGYLMEVILIFWLWGYLVEVILVLCARYQLIRYLHLLIKNHILYNVCSNHSHTQYIFFHVFFCLITGTDPKKNIQQILQVINCTIKYYYNSYTTRIT